jgi:serine/threonine protein kinase
METSNAATNLLGRKLESGWEVIEIIDKPDYATGSFFSVCYKVRKSKEICFLKAFDFAKFFQISEPNKKSVDVMTDMLNAYRYEKQLSDFCRGHHVTKVVFVKDAGEENIEGFTYPIVPYLIFDLADGDVRKNLLFSDKLDIIWRLKSLHDIAVGLKQLHYIEVSHQDLKPSNILLFKGESKIGDLGRSICRSISSPYDKLAFAGDFNYAPPEIMYGHYLVDWHQRVFATDCYLLGSMVVFYFIGISMSALLSKYIPPPFRYDQWHGNFDDIRPYILNAFSEALYEFEKSIRDDYLRKELRWIVDKLCYPLPEERGHPKNVIMKGNPYDVERFVSKFDLLHKKAMYGLIYNG